MKQIILAAGKSKNSLEKSPKCLFEFENKTVLDSILKISNNINDVNIIGGFEILQIMEKYPMLKYFYNEQWESTKSLYSFSKAFPTLNDSCLISYSDVIHTNTTISNINEHKINIFYDSKWKVRYENRDLECVEKIFDKSNNILGEFSGLLYLPKSQIFEIQIISEKLLKNNLQATLLDLISLLITKYSNIDFIDVSGNWAELDSIQDIEHFKFGTKAETLKNLKTKLNKSIVLEQYTFTVEDYLDDEKQIVKNIRSAIGSNLLVVRSSALNEDTEKSSMAGNYESILKVKKDDDSILKNAIEVVIDSYKKGKQEQDKDNQVLIQPYLENVTMSGVVFSKNLQTSSPYYTVNYDESSDTESVTSGNGNDLNTFICYNNYSTTIKDKKLKVLIDAVKEIESVTRYDAIDVEFAFVKKNLYILQVRPIAAKKDSVVVSTNEIRDEINNIKKYLTRNTFNLIGNKKAYGVMPDWNPAEIIGTNPKTLAFDLYKYIITDNIWSKSRKNLGYRNVYDNVGLVSFGGKPYVDIQMSFNTFIPTKLSDDIASKLVDYFMDKLEENPENHDKVEFLVAITAYDFNFDKKINELMAYGFTTLECEDIKNAYKNLTEDIIKEKTISIESEINKTISLTNKRTKILKSNLNDIDKIYTLLEDCKNYGTLPFSNLARCGFIGSIFLKSLLLNNTINKNEYDEFFKSINTVAKDFMDNFNLLINNKIDKNEFLNKYGHLRPGTYDITSKTYKEGFDDYIDYDSNTVDDNHDLRFEFSSKIKQKIKQNINNHSLMFTTEELIRFIRKATEAREKAKFEFTKNLSAAMELIIKIGSSMGISRDDLANLNLDLILRYKKSSSTLGKKSTFIDNIVVNKEKYLITSALQLPELIFNEKDVEMFYYPSLKPNFVSHHSLIGEIIFLTNGEKLDIDGKIVLIENADPGFDWIFSHNIKGLVTKYGGAASHMAIRCAEFDLPAAIGCGDKIFNSLICCNKINLDCINQKIESL